MHLNFEQAILDVILLWLLTTPHEFAHAWVATRLGDDTPRAQGRLTLNPLAHIDWIGTTALPFITSLLSGGFIGWGKPVYTQTSKLRGGLNGLALVALAGPAMNVVMAVVLAILAVAAARSIPLLAGFLAQGVRLSLYLAIFNMIPVPPLDGSKLLLAARIPMVIYNEIARAGFMLLILLVTFTNVSHYMSLWAYEGYVAIFHALQQG
jgi:Zn-dependent protease